MTEPLLEFFFMKGNEIKKTTGDGMTRFALANGERPKKTEDSNLDLLIL